MDGDISDQKMITTITTTFKCESEEFQWWVLQPGACADTCIFLKIQEVKARFS